MRVGWSLKRKPISSAKTIKHKYSVKYRAPFLCVLKYQMDTIALVNSHKCNSINKVVDKAVKDMWIMMDYQFYPPNA